MEDMQLTTIVCKSIQSLTEDATSDFNLWKIEPELSMTKKEKWAVWLVKNSRWLGPWYSNYSTNM